ncbi:MAG: hypothetical protein H6747_11600 [Deltaproteobacteria bacterium]|nr:hypothetical protein [Deltaproteobacteria bacterium]
MIRIRLLLVAASLLTVACAPTPLVRLAGDPPQAEPLTQPYKDLHPAADGVRRFVRACETGQWEMAWDGLSKQTRLALSVRARPAGARGIDLLRPLPADADPGLRQLHVGDALQRFALPGAKEFNVPEEVWPVEQRYDGRRLEAAVAVKDAAGASRQVVVAFEDAGWRIHNPKLEGPGAGDAP